VLTLLDRFGGGWLYFMIQVNIVNMDFLIQVNIVRECFIISIV
jgi:hypothetical protein